MTFENRLVDQKLRVAHWLLLQECAHLIALALPHMVKSAVVDNDTGKSVDSRRVKARAIGPSVAGLRAKCYGNLKVRQTLSPLEVR